MSELLQEAIDNFDEVEPILMKIDFEPARKLWEKWAVKKHFKLLKANKEFMYGKRVKPMRELVKEKMKAQSLVFAMGIAKILSELKEGETRFYVNLQISKKNGKIIAIPKEEA